MWRVHPPNRKEPDMADRDTDAIPPDFDGETEDDDPSEVQ
jgi:hypothetical protein